MGVFDKLKDLVGLEEVGDEEITEEEIKTAAAEYEKTQSAAKSASLQDKSSAKTQPRPQAPSRTFGNTSTNPFKLVVIEPKSFEETSKLVDSLKSRKPVIVNLEKVEYDTARKIFDFLNGATYALNGTVQKVANNIFIFAPENVDIAASVEHKGIEFDSAKKKGGSLWGK